MPLLIVAVVVASTVALVTLGWSWSRFGLRGRADGFDVAGAARSGAAERLSVALGLLLFVPKGAIIEWSVGQAKRKASACDVAGALVSDPQRLTDENVLPPRAGEDPGESPAGGAPVGLTARAFVLGFGLALLVIGHLDRKPRGAVKMVLGAASAAACLNRSSRDDGP